MLHSWPRKVYWRLLAELHRGSDRPGCHAHVFVSMERPGFPESLGHAHEDVSMAPKSLAQHHLRFISWSRGGDQDTNKPLFPTLPYPAICNILNGLYHSIPFRGVGQITPRPPARSRPDARVRRRRSHSTHVLTNRDSPRTIWRVMMAKCVCMMHFQANWNRYRGGRPEVSSFRRYLAYTGR